MNPIDMTSFPYGIDIDRNKNITPHWEDYS